ncbi:MAG: lysoplasmalogenase [Anaerolineae bacterium]|nr:lysoplasmalogenase [Anaerolineae bacterium]
MLLDVFGSGQQVLLVILWLLWAALLFGGFLIGKTRPDGSRRMPVWTRMTSSLTLVIVGWCCVVFTQETPANSYAFGVAVGMTLGFLGDLFMAELLPVKDHILGGIGAFGLGHLAYIAAFLLFGDQNGLNESGLRWGAWLTWLVVGTAGWYFVVYRNQKPTFLHRAALPYALLLASTAGFATGLALQNGGFILLTVGAALFLLSDLILAARLFNNLHFRLIDDVVWFTYGPAQMLIVYSITVAATVTLQ